MCDIITEKSSKKQVKSKQLFNKGEKMEYVVFGNINGKEIKKYTLKKGNVRADILTLGGVIQSFGLVENDEFFDVVLGYETVEEYLSNSGYLGALIGRVGNRTGKGQFTLNGKTYNVGLNDNGNSLHGGINGFDKKIWDDKVDGDTLVLTCFSPDGEEGYPGNLTLTVKYSIVDDGLKIEYFAESDADTVVNFTNHVYFNLNGQGNGDILDTALTLNSDYVTPVDDQLICYNEFMAVENTPFDFRTEKVVGDDIDADNDLIKICGGFDINYVVKGNGFREVGVAKGGKSGVKLSVYRDQDGVQFYSGNFLNGAKGKNNSVYNRRWGFCLETQNFPNAINCDKFPSSVLKKGEKFYSATLYKIGR